MSCVDKGFLSWFVCVDAFVADEEPCVNVRCSDMGQAEMYFVDDNMLD